MKFCINERYYVHTTGMRNSLIEYIFAYKNHSDMLRMQTFPYIKSVFQNISKLSRIQSTNQLCIVRNRFGDGYSTSYIGFSNGRKTSRFSFTYTPPGTHFLLNAFNRIEMNPREIGKIKSY